MRLVKRHLESLDASRLVSEATIMNCNHEPVEDRTRQELGCRVLPRERGLVVQVPEIKLSEDLFERRAGESDVNDQAVSVERVAPERGIDHVGRSVEPLGRSEDLAPEAVGDHEVIANVKTVQWFDLQAAPGRGQGWA